MSDTSLVVESGLAKDCQAQLTRLQMALGLKEKLKDEDCKKLSYGQKLPAIANDVPTGFSRCEDAILMSVDIDIRYDEDMLTCVTWAVRSFETAFLKDESPKDYAQVLHKSRTFGGNWDATGNSPKQGLFEHTLAGIRRAINDAFEPMCLDHCSRSAHENIQSDHSQTTASDLAICNPKRYVCNNLAHYNDRDNYDHTLHKECKPRRNIILVLPEKEACLENLQTLGCILSKHLHIIDIIDVRELYQAFLVRHDYNFRHPMTRDHRTNISHDWTDCPSNHQIWETLGHETAGSGTKKTARNARTLLHLKAAVEIASRDALSSSWLRTLEQVSGGPFPGPRVKFNSRSEVEAFLVEYDVARVNAISHSSVKARAKALIDTLPFLNREAYDLLIQQLAKTHNYAHLLQLRFEAPAITSSATLADGSKDVKILSLQSKVVEKFESPLSQASATIIRSRTTPLSDGSRDSENLPLQSKVVEKVESPLSQASATIIQSRTTPLSDGSRDSENLPLQSKVVEKGKSPPSQASATSTQSETTAHSDGSKDSKNVPIQSKVVEKGKSPPSQASATSTQSVTTPSSTTTTSTLPPLELDDELDYKTHNHCRQYHHDHEAFDKELRDAPVSPEHKERYDSLFDWKPYTDQRGRNKVTPISCENYPRVFAILKATEGWAMSASMARVLRGAIFNREKVQEWYRRLPDEDPRRKDDDGHENILKVLRDGEALLLKPSS